MNKDRMEEEIAEMNGEAEEVENEEENGRRRRGSRKNNE